ncbi:MAG: hypothetical protein WKG32_20095 [Gemmatimonadaceae bacterium]
MMETSTTQVHAPARDHHHARAGDDARPDLASPTPMQVRAADMEPYVGLRYVAKLFRIIALILVMLLIAEVATGLYQHGSEAVPTLLGEGSRLLVLAGVLWGAGDLAILLIDIGHDLRATRILIGRQAAHHPPPSVPAPHVEPARVSPAAPDR